MSNQETPRRPTFSADAYAPQGWRRFSHAELDSLSRAAIDIALRLDTLEPVARGAVLTAIRAEVARMRRCGRVRDVAQAGRARQC